MKRIYLFTTSGCPFCNELSRLLINARFSFFTWDIEEHEDEFLKIIEESGRDMVPAVMIKDASNGAIKYILPERDFQHLEQCVELVRANIYN